MEYNLYTDDGEEWRWEEEEDYVDGLERRDALGPQWN